MKSQFHAQGDMNESKLPIEAESEPATEAKLTPVPAVALLRGAGHVFDLLLFAFLTLIPLIYHTSAHEAYDSVKWNLDIVEFLTKAYGASMIGLVLALTPLPIIYMRLFFKKLMKTPTPGEMIAGITSYSTAPGIEGVVQESLYGLAEYVICLFALVFACIATFIIMYALGIVDLIFQNIGFTFQSDSLIIIIASIIFAGSFITAVGFGFVPHSREDIASFFDDYCQLTVKRLR